MDEKAGYTSYKVCRVIQPNHRIAINSSVLPALHWLITYSTVYIAYPTKEHSAIRTRLNSLDLCLNKIEYCNGDDINSCLQSLSLGKIKMVVKYGRMTRRSCMKLRLVRSFDQEIYF